MLVSLEFPIATLDLNRRAFFLAELRESPALGCEALKQRRGLPVFTVLPVEFRHALVNVFQADRIRVPHRTSAMGGETVAIEPRLLSDVVSLALQGTMQSATTWRKIARVSGGA